MSGDLLFNLEDALPDDDVAFAKSSMTEVPGARIKVLEITDGLPVSVKDEHTIDDAIIAANAASRPHSHVSSLSTTPTVSDASKLLLSGEQELNEPVKLSKPRVGVGDFEVLSMIGQGSYGSVFKVRKKDSSTIYAMKVLNKDHVIEKDIIGSTNEERYVMEAVEHPFFVRLRYAFQTPSKLFLIMDYVHGGDLFTRLDIVRRLDEQSVKLYAACVVLALEYLHGNHMIYRDLKPENMLICADGYMCLTDFGFAKRLQDSKTKTFCGTQEYMAPEVILKGKNAGHGAEADWWSLGCVLYEMVEGRSLFNGANKKAVQNKICSGKIRFPDHFPFELKRLLKGLLDRTPHKRFSAPQVKAHVYFSGLDWDALYKKQITPSYVPASPTSALDVSFFEDKFTKESTAMLESPSLGPSSMVAANNHHFVGFSYYRESPVFSPVAISNSETKLSGVVPDLSLNDGALSLPPPAPARITARDEKNTILKSSFQKQLTQQQEEQQKQNDQTKFSPSEAPSKAPGQNTNFRFNANAPVFIPSWG